MNYIRLSTEKNSKVGVSGEVKNTLKSVVLFEMQY